MNARTYLDWNATAPLRPEARAVVEEALARLGNPSSVHQEGRAARQRIEAAREQVASLAAVAPRCVTFTSGGSEANTLALGPRWGGSDRPLRRLLVSAIEHPSVLAGGDFAAADIRTIPVTGDGIVDLAAFDSLLADCAADGVTPLVSVMLANNETGVIQPVAAVAEKVRTAGGLFHVDAVQAPGRLDCRMDRLGADLLTLSAHKIGGPTGVGALVRRSDTLHRDAVIRGGGQERGLRAGTENVPGIAGFGAAAAAVSIHGSDERDRVQVLRDRLEAGLLAISPQGAIIGHGRERLPNTTLFAVPGAKAETLVIGFDLAGIAVSSGAACSSGKVGPSHVLAAMGVEERLARSAIRFSLGWKTVESDIDRTLEAWKRLASGLSQTPDAMPPGRIAAVKQSA